VITDGRAVGLERDQAKAFALFQRAADLGDPEAMHHLAEAHAEGKGVPRDARRAFQLCCEAALRGSSAALLRLFSQFGLSGVYTLSLHTTHTTVRHTPPHRTTRHAQG
jgi:TPR repeat protein